MPVANKTKIPVGTVLAGKYRVTREIGRGGMAAVYEAANVDIGKRVAIKVLAQELTTSAVVVERFLREARAAAAIRSPYICDIYDSGRLDDGRPFLVLELLEGDSLYERMTKIRWLDVETTVGIVSQVCRGLTKAHAANIVHRDLKPENIFLTKDEEGRLLSKILDFGLAKFYAPMEEGDGPQARLTREGAVFGTPAYMSPEQVRGQGAVDHRADLWALGCIVYECFTGRTVWSTEQGVAMTFAQIANAELPRPQTFRPDLPDAFTTWFERALNRDIEKRFQTARQLSDDFASVFNQAKYEISGIQSSPASSLPKFIRDGIDNPFLQGGEPTFDGPTSGPASGPTGPTSGGVPKSGRTSQPAPVASAVPRPSGDMQEVLQSLNESAKDSLGSLGAIRTSGPESTTSRPPALPSSGSASRRRVVAGGVIGALAVGVIGFVAWSRLSDNHASSGTPPVSTSAAPSASVTSSAGPDSSATSSASTVAPTSASATATIPHPSSSTDAPTFPWISLMRDGQQAIAAGDLKLATKLLKEAFDKGGGHGVPRTMLEHLGIASASAVGDRSGCRLAGLSRPRTYDLSAGAHPVPAGRPTIAVGPKGAIVAWTDAHEGPEQAYAVALDEALRDRGVPVNVTPEGGGVLRPALTVASGPNGPSDRFVITYVDSRGAEAGLHARLLDADGHVIGPSVVVAGMKAMTTSPAITSTPDGFVVAWTEEGDGDSEDLFLRRLGPSLEMREEPLRTTDLVALGPSRARARFPTVAASGAALFVDFRLERDPVRLIQEIRLPFADFAKSGLQPQKKGDKKADRNLGEIALVNVDKSKADNPSLSCGGGACYLSWHGETGGGAWVAYVDPASAPPVVRRHFSKQGQRPAVAAASNGQGQIAWFETGRVLTASVSKDNVGSPARIARVSGDQPTPAIAPGNQPGEWYLAWLDYETGHLEPYVARVQCK